MMKLEKAEEEQWEEERRRMCVVCVSEEREVILWPCACLALCDVSLETISDPPFV